MGLCMSKVAGIDNEYKSWIDDIYKAYKNSQIKASVKVNSEMLMFYWFLGWKMDELKKNVACGYKCETTCFAND